MRTLAKTSDALDRLCRWGALAALVLMVLLIGIQVAARYLWRDPPGWTEEGARYAMVWAGLLGATVSFRAGFDPVLAKFKMFERGALRAAAVALRAIATVLFLGPVLFFCVFGPNYDISRGYLARSAERAAEAIGLPMVWFTAALPIAIVVIFIHLLADLAGRQPAEPK
ncbi:MAG: TRAP transporter small permease subunit [Candidatus Odyssella sp.]|nr:TRAP transporter small permease subunit [Candidatus Odyssella sp.]